jgi:hypothetical protein
MKKQVVSFHASHGTRHPTILETTTGQTLSSSLTVNLEIIPSRVTRWTCEVRSLAEDDEPVASPLDPAGNETLVGCVPQDTTLREDSETRIVRQQSGVIPHPDYLTLRGPLQVAEAGRPVLLQQRCLRPPRAVIADSVIIFGEQPGQGFEVVPRGGFPETIVQYQDRVTHGAKLPWARGVVGDCMRDPRSPRPDDHTHNEAAFRRRLGSVRHGRRSCFQSMPGSQAWSRR